MYFLYILLQIINKINHIQKFSELYTYIGSTRAGRASGIRRGLTECPEPFLRNTVTLQKTRTTHPTCINH